jgi:hypothetical protein
MFDHIPPELRNAGPGVAGSILALLFLRRPPLILAGMFLGGCTLSFFATPWLAAYMEVGVHGSSLVGFLAGLFGMATTSKVYDLIDVVEVGQIWKALIDFIRKRLGVEDKQ